MPPLPSDPSGPGGRPMTSYVALLRAVNVGGTGILPMKELSALCARLGLEEVRTYIQSGNVVFRSALAEDRVRASLEGALEERMGRRVDVLLRDAPALRRVLEANPFPDAEPSRVAVAFFHDPLPPSLLERVVAPGGEEVVLGDRELYVHYPHGMGRSKLKLPTTEGPSTARNLNTVARLVAMASA